MTKKAFKAACTFVATMIGAGFASGREISLYFENSAPTIPLLSALLCGFFCFVCLELGRKSGGDILPDIFKKALPVAEIAARLSNFIVYCAMVAGMELLFYDLVGFHGAGLIAALLACLNVVSGTEKLKLVNAVAVPTIIAAIILISVKVKPEVSFSGKLNLSQGILYAGLNIFSGGYLISGFSKDFSKKECIYAGVLSGIILSILLLLIFFTISDFSEKAMPFLSAALSEGLGLAGGFVLFLAIYTTMTGSLSIAAKRSKPACLLLTSAALVISLLGFSFLVNGFYPVIGWFGLAFSVIILIYYLYKLNILVADDT